MTQELNQFGQFAERGQIALLNGNSNVISVMIDVSQTAPLKSGDGVKIVETSNGIPKVVAVEDVSDIPAGFILFNTIKNANFTAGDRAEIAIKGSFIYAIAVGAISAGASVQYDPANGKVSAAASASNSCANSSSVI
jgi:hypothetical protein